MKKHRPVLHSSKRENADMLATVIEQLRVNLIRENNQIMPDRQRRNLLQLFHRLKGPGRIRREIQHDDLGPRSDRLLNIASAKHKIILGPGVNRHRHPPSHKNGRVVAHITRLMVNHLVPRIQQRPKSNVQRLADPHRHNDLLRRIILGRTMTPNIARNRLAQRQQSQIRGVTRLPLLQSEYRRLPDMPRCRKIRLAHPQRNHIATALN